MADRDQSPSLVPDPPMPPISRSIVFDNLTRPSTEVASPTRTTELHDSFCPSSPEPLTTRSIQPTSQGDTTLNLTWPLTETKTKLPFVDDESLRDYYEIGLASRLTREARLFALKVNSALAGTFIVYDTETTGINRGDIVIQLAYMVCDSSGTPMHTYNHLWKTNDGRQIPRSATKIHHIKTADLIANGVRMPPELCAFYRLVDLCNHLGVRVVAHNVAFDCRLLDQTAKLGGIHETINQQPMFCTMLAATDKTNFTTSTGRKKYPKNSELYVYLHHREPTERLHDALGDIRVTAANYVAGRRRRWW